MRTESAGEIQLTGADAMKAFDWLKKYATDHPKQVEAAHAVMLWARAVQDRNAYKMLLNKLP